MRNLSLVVLLCAASATVMASAPRHYLRVPSAGIRAPGALAADPVQLPGKVPEAPPVVTTPPMEEVPPPPAATPMMAVAPTLLNFGAIAAGSTASGSFIVSNTGNGVMTLVPPTTASAFFTITDYCGTKLAAGASCSYTIQFKNAVAAGNKMLSFSVNTDGGTKSVAAQGKTI